MTKFKPSTISSSKTLPTGSSDVMQLMTQIGVRSSSSTVRLESNRLLPIQLPKRSSANILKGETVTIPVNVDEDVFY